jgi:hypothetical protein
MNRIFVVLILLVVGIACLGFYRGWFHVGSESGDGKANITLSVDKQKIKADEDKALEKLHGLGKTEPTAAPPTQVVK